MFRTSRVNPHGGSSICSMVCFTCICVSSLADRRVCAYTTVSLRMNPRGSKHVGDIKNYILIYKIVHFVDFCCIIVPKCTVKNKRGQEFIKIKLLH